MSYPIKAFLETMFSFDNAAKDSYLKTSLWYKDEAETATAFEKTATSSGYNKRQEIIKKGKRVHFSSMIHHDLFALRKYL